MFGQEAAETSAACILKLMHNNQLLNWFTGCQKSKNFDILICLTYPNTEQRMFDRLGRPRTEVRLISWLDFNPIWIMSVCVCVTCPNLTCLSSSSTISHFSLCNMQYVECVEVWTARTHVGIHTYIGKYIPTQQQQQSVYSIFDM